MKVDAFLEKLSKVKRTGSGSWLACCPAHEDRSPSLSVGEGSDGRVLIRCFAGCEPSDIVGAVGVSIADLFPEKPKADFVPGLRRPFPAADALEALASESLIVAVAACNVANGIALTEEDKTRLLLAQSRIEEARRLALG